MFKIFWHPKAYKQLIKIRNQKDIDAVYDAACTLTQWPDCQNIKALKNHSYGYRLRVGKFRVLFDVRDSIRIIEIQEVKKRDEHTY
jgi:mRNA-degrading endonuclease RelE of RelBE toxin-antitoxin system